MGIEDGCLDWLMLLLDQMSRVLYKDDILKTNHMTTPIHVICPAKFNGMRDASCAEMQTLAMASTPSSVASFHTAMDVSPKRSVRSKMDLPVTPKRGAVDDTDPAAGLQTLTTTIYRPVRQLPYELKGHVRVFLEEHMYSEAIQLLTSLASAGGSEQWSDTTTISSTATVLASGSGGSPTKRTPHWRATLTRPPPVWLPPASHLALLATLAVHPAYTTRRQDTTDARVAGHALQYLRHVLAVAGPVQADLREAFIFGEAPGQRRTNRDGRGGRGGRDGRGGRMASSGRSGGEGGSTAGGSHTRLRPRRAAATTGYVDSRTLSLDTPSQEMAMAAAAAAHERDKADTADTDYMHAGADADTIADTDADEDAVSGRLATRDSVWARGQDFWRVAGWALRCSVEAPARWQYWRPWLTLMVDVLEADLAEAAAAQDDQDNQSTPGSVHLEQSLLCTYLSGWGGHTQLRHLALAILADGSQTAHLVEVFDRETAERPGAAATTTQPTRLLDLDNRFGDYSDEESPPPAEADADTKVNTNTKQAQAQAQAKDTVTIPDTGNQPGFQESLPLRRRLFYLVVLAARYIPDAFAPIDAVYRTFADVLRETEITVFAAFVAAAPPPAAAVLWTRAPPPVTADDALVGLLRRLLFAVLPASAPKPRAVDVEADSRLDVSAAMLVRCFLPFAANTVALGANVRMALVLESLLRVVWTRGGLDGADSVVWIEPLQAAAETGVRAREARPGAAKKRGLELDAFGRALLRRSGQRLLAMVAFSQGA